MRFHKIALTFLFLLGLNLPAVHAHGGGATASSPHSSMGGQEISSDAMINQPTASTLGKNHVSAGFAFDYLNYNSIPAENAHALHHRGHDVHGKNVEESYIFNLRYGLLSDWDVDLSAPIVSKNSIDIESHRNLGRKDRATGFGDLHLSTQYRFWKKYVEAALILGIKFPTGQTDSKRKSGEKFETENQPGSGSWDSDYGLVLSRSFQKHFSISTSFLYVLHGEGAQEHRSGDTFRYNAGFSYSLRKLGKHPNLSLVTELNTEWALHDKSREEKNVADSGGTTIFITPGFTSTLTKNISMFWGIAIPIYQDLGGEHEELNFEMLTGINFSL